MVCATALSRMAVYTMHVLSTNSTTLMHTMQAKGTAKYTRSAFLLENQQRSLCPNLGQISLGMPLLSCIRSTATVKATRTIGVSQPVAEYAAKRPQRSPALMRS